ncbi:hypothetical protein BH10ACI3_BH10ACI3_05100 [soil metagenome]
MKYYAVCITFLTLTLFLSASAQKNSSALTEYSALEKVCQESITSEKWEAAERDCNAALAGSVTLPARYKREKMHALDNYAFSLFSQSKFELALKSFTRALEIGKTFLSASSAELGRAYFNVGRANQGMASIEGRYIVPAETNYLTAEKIYRAAYAVAADEKAKIKVKDSISGTLVLLEYIALMRGEDAKVKAIEARMAALAKLK